MKFASDGKPVLVLISGITIRERDSNLRPGPVPRRRHRDRSYLPKVGQSTLLVGTYLGCSR